MEGNRAEVEVRSINHPHNFPLFLACLVHLCDKQNPNLGLSIDVLLHQKNFISWNNEGLRKFGSWYHALQPDDIPHHIIST